jgi:hypothetical protein
LLVIESGNRIAFGSGIVTNSSRSSSYECSASSKTPYMPVLCSGGLSGLGSASD